MNYAKLSNQEMSNRNINIDILRVIGMLMILIVHTGYEYDLGEVTYYGSKGVQLFFILSGFLIMNSLEGNDDFVLFYKRRFISIIPAYWTVLSIEYIYDFIIQFSNHVPFKDIFFNDGVCSIQYLRYFVGGQCLVPAKNYALFTNRYALWTMTSFLVFYLLAPFIFKLVRGKNGFIITLTSLILLCVIRTPLSNFIKKIFAEWPAESHIEYFANEFPICQLYCFYFGIILWTALRSNHEGHLLMILIISLIIAISISSLYLWEIVFTMFLYVSVATVEFIRNGIIANLIKYWAKRSFLVYLIHPVIIDFMAKIYSRVLIYNVLKLFVTSIIVFILSDVLYRITLNEKDFIKRYFFNKCKCSLNFMEGLLLMKYFKAFKDIVDKLYYVMSKQRRKEAVLVVVFLIVGSLLELLGISVILPLIYAILDINTLSSNDKFDFIRNLFRLDSDMSVIVFCITAVILIYVVKNTMLVFINYRKQHFSCSFKEEVSTNMLDAFMHQPYSYYLKANMGDILHGITADVEASCNTLNTILQMSSDIFGILFIIIFLFLIEPSITIIFLFLALLCVVLLFSVVKAKTKEMGYKQRELTREAYQSAFQAVYGIKDIMVTKREVFFVEKYNNLYFQKKKIDIKYNTMLGLPTRIVETVFISGLAIIVGLRASSGSNNAAFVASLAVFAVASMKLLPYISSTVSNITQLVYMRLNVFVIFDNLKSTENRTESVEKVHKVTFEDALIIDNISWKYPGAESTTLNNLSLKISKGESIGLVGESGAGKTTLADIVLGLYHPQSGTVKIDGCDIKEMPYSWSRIVGYVPQTVYLLDDTIRNNVLFGQKFDGDDNKIWNALRQAQLEKFVKTLPEGLDTVVGERGIRFSGGQRQRVAIARTLYYNPQILVLDEATSALDNETEEALMEAIDSLQGTKTLIIVAHRLSTIRNCNKVYEIKNGQAVPKEIDS